MTGTELTLPAIQQSIPGVSSALLFPLNPNTKLFKKKKKNKTKQNKRLTWWCTSVI
jgi:hypothetical protein